MRTLIESILDGNLDAHDEAVFTDQIIPEIRNLIHPYNAQCVEEEHHGQLGPLLLHVEVCFFLVDHSSVGLVRSVALPLGCWAPCERRQAVAGVSSRSDVCGMNVCSLGDERAEEVGCGQQSRVVGRVFGGQHGSEGESLS